MAISPPGDIVMDVLRAADPGAVESARAKLRANEAERLAESGPFAAPQLAADATRAAPKAPPQQTPYAKFEAMVLGTFIQSMLPEEAGTVYGDGMAGEMWKSLLAQQLGDVMSERGGIGIASRLLADHYKDGDRKVPLAGINDGSARAEVDIQQSLSTALVQELQRNMARSVIGDDGAASEKTGPAKG